MVTDKPKKVYKPAKNHPWKTDFRSHAKDDRREYHFTRIATFNRMGIRI